MCGGGGNGKAKVKEAPPGYKYELRQGDGPRKYMHLVADPNYKAPEKGVVNAPPPSGGTATVNPDGTVTSGNKPSGPATDTGGSYGPGGTVVTDVNEGAVAVDAVGGDVLLGGSRTNRRRKGVVGLAI